MRERINSAHVLALIAIILAIGGNAFAFTLGKNSVGSKQLKKNAVTTAKLKNESVTAAKVKKGTLTGTQINAATLGTVPAAQTAQTAQSANSLAAPEGWHEVTDFLNGWGNLTLSLSHPESVAYYKDQEGIVHLRGEAVGGGSNTAIFRLPLGYRPAAGRFIEESAACVGGGCPNEVGRVKITGSNQTLVGDEGIVIAPMNATSVFLDGITFRAAS